MSGRKRKFPAEYIVPEDDVFAELNDLRDQRDIREPEAHDDGQESGDSPSDGHHEGREEHGANDFENGDDAVVVSSDENDPDDFDDLRQPLGNASEPHDPVGEDGRLHQQTGAARETSPQQPHEHEQDHEHGQDGDEVQDVEGDDHPSDQDPDDIPDNHEPNCK